MIRSGRFRTRVSLYGNTAIRKAYCEECGCMAMVIDGNLQCCDRASDDEPNAVKREVESVFSRKPPPTTAQKEILDAQGHRCFWCDRAFGSYVFKGTRRRRLVINWDHLVPFVWSGDNSTNNFVAACQVCNGLKSSRMYRTIEEAKVDLQARWEEAGYV